VNQIEHELEITSREALTYQLVEAAELEHNLMCCYLYAAWSIRDERDGLQPHQAKELTSWRRALLAIAVEEMTHLALVNNLLLALGSPPHFSRPNFPVPPGMHPASIVVELAPFTRDTLDHFIFLERPEGSQDPDGESFAQRRATYKREMPMQRLMPSAQEFATVGHFYRSLRRGLDGLCEKLTESVLFIGDKRLQVGPDLVRLPGLIKVEGIASARIALDTIVTQGEGATTDAATSHYRRLIAIRDGWDNLLSQQPGLVPSRPCARNPVMRRPPSPDNKIFMDEDAAGNVVDIGNSLYCLMLRALTQGFADNDPSVKQVMLDVAIDGMFALSPFGEHATTLAANRSHPGVNAGLSFAMLRDLSPLPAGGASKQIIGERLLEIHQRAKDILADQPQLQSAIDTVHKLANKLGVGSSSQQRSIEVAKGKSVTILFEAKRCIHARSCVLSAPTVFKANTPGEWIFPDTMNADALVAVAENCPSGAIQYQRSNEAAEAAPLVNSLHVRERGPYAVRAPLVISGQAMGNRATLCRCGASANKPYCDGSHVAAQFDASGEPATRPSEPLAVRNGELKVTPQKNGPLLLRGNLEICAGTGRTIDRVDSCALCRCGHSKNKPFCDGTHAAIGFVAD
jgi:CDGSH-type Zn-finger protein/uncharacterized Fe-S cluster protein YjdI